MQETIKLCPSTLIVFGNPPLGTQFLTAKPESSVDWPMRRWKGRTAYTEFAWITRNRQAGHVPYVDTDRCNVRAERMQRAGTCL